MDDIDLHYDRVTALRGRYLGPCDCHLRPAMAQVDPGERTGQAPASDCPKCHGEGELYAREEP